MPASRRHSFQAGLVRWVKMPAWATVLAFLLVTGVKPVLSVFGLCKVELKEGFLGFGFVMANL